MDKLARFRILFAAAALGFAASALGAEGQYGSVPLHERERHLIESSNELEGYFAAQSMLHNDAGVLSLVRRIGHDLAPAPTDDYIEYEFFVLRDPSPNAFALPNGHIYVHTGMLARLEDDAQLAALLAHEINHVAGHHGIVHNRSTSKKVIAGLVLQGIGGWGGAISAGLHASVFGYSRGLEREADERAPALVAAKGYDPHALAEVFEILGRDYEGIEPRVQSIWSTHPELEARAAESRQAVAGLARPERGAEAFEIAVFSLRLTTIEDYIRDDYPQTAVALAESLDARYPGEPALLRVLGDAWQAMGAEDRIEPESLSGADKRRNRRARIRMTRAERLAEALETDEGRAAYAANLARAEAAYRRALELNPAFAPAHRGLGEVYEQLERDRDAAGAYLTYVRSAPEAPDRTVVVGRLRVLADRIKQQESSP